MKPSAKILALPSRLECADCGASVKAACDCHAPYVPAGARAAKALAENPAKSDRAIAAELGVGAETVRRARQSTAPHEAVEKRTGRDGKTRQMPKARTLIVDEPFCKVNPHVTAFLKELDFFPGFIRRLEEWIDSQPDLDDEAIFALVNNLTGVSIEVGRLAQKIDGR